jgi:GNAT superfamily N-acetyltransferase
VSDERLVIKVIGVGDVENAPNVTALLDEYASYGLPELPHPCTKFETYRHLESLDAIHVIGAFYDDRLIGFISILRPISAHYGFCLAVTESFFVQKDYRHTGAGRALLNAAKEYRRATGCEGLVVVLPSGTNDAAAKRMGLRLVNKSYFVEDQDGH